MRVRVTVRKVAGHFRKRVVVHCDDPARPTVELVVAGRRVPWVAVLPQPYIVLDGPPGVPRRATRLLAPTDPADTAFAVTGGECDVGDLVTWAVEPVDSARAWRVTVERRPDAPSGLSFGTLRLQTRAVHGRRVEIPVRVVTRGAISARPASIDFGVVPAGVERPVERAVIVGGRGVPFRVLEVRCDDPAFTATVAESASPGRARVIVACQPGRGARPGRRRARVVLVTDDAVTPRVAVDVRVRVTRPRRGR